MQGVRRVAIVRPMTLAQLSALAQIVGAGAVLASLIFVGLQIRQNTQSQRVVAVESLAAAIAAINGGRAAARLSRRSFRPILQRRSHRKRLPRWPIFSAKTL